MEDLSQELASTIERLNREKEQLRQSKDNQIKQLETDKEEQRV
jgi:hypothetical protein